MLTKSDKYGRGSAAANGEGFADLAPGDTFAALETQLKRRIAERFDNVALGISATIGSNRNASELAKHLASGEEEEPHKFAAKNIGVLFARGRIAFSHGDKKAVAGQRWVTRFIRVFTSFQFAGRRYLATLTLKDVDPDRKLYAVEAVEINQDAKSRSTPRGAMSEDLNSAPFQDLTSQLREMVAYYVGDVNRTRPQFVGSPEPFSVERTAVLLETMMRDSGLGHPASRIPRLAPAFTIIIPVYNVAPYLRECLDSVACAAANVEKLKGCKVEKSGEGVEVICVDDGSTDGSGVILDEYASRFTSSPLQPFNFKVIHQPNRGVSAARNTALDVATGEWVLFVDADDVISPQTLDVCRNAVGRFGSVDLVRFRHVVFPQDGRPVGLADGSSVVTVTCVDMTRRLDVGIADSSMSFWTVAYRHDLLDGIRFEVGRRYGEDRIFLADFLQRCNRIAVTDAVCYGYRQRADSAIHLQQTGRILREELSCWIACCERLLADRRTIDASCLRRWALVLTETFARRYYQLPPAERRGHLDFWRREMERLDGLLPRFPFWARSVMRILHRVPVSPLFWLLCFFPDFLKRKGFHR